ncbi:hypothetical protein [Achromobacter xylosoxidans]|uniref:hypothetical protein n=1 Tax=Alcaligenes xylosoxydans xylosoxydans TaxID=85698 RepID=UPI001F131863|nr:hypothetical protein [Achromobacter xylosoxidans]
MNSPIKLPELPLAEVPAEEEFADGWKEWPAHPDYYTKDQMRAYAEQAVRDALAAQQLKDETQALIDHDNWFSEYGLRMGTFYNSLTLHTRAAWVAAAKRYGALPTPPKENNHGDTP